MRPTSEPGTIEGRKRCLPFLAVAGMAAIIIGMLSMIFVLYKAPPVFPTQLGYFSPAGALYFARTIFGRTPVSFTKSEFATCLRLALCLAWAGYALAVWAGLQGKAPSPKVVLAVSIALSLTIALLCPPTLCKDAFGYVAYGRLQAFYGLNPYAYGQKYIKHFHDPTVRFLFWNIRCPYGPLWTHLSIAIVAILRMSGLFWQVVGFKLFAAACLIGCSLTGRTIADRFQRGRGDLTLLAIGLNPLFLVEGPGSGHNELLMIGLVLVVILLALRKRWIAALLALGLSASVKYLPLAILPWLMIRSPRGMRLRKQIPLAALMILMALIPMVLLYAPLWDHGAPLKGMQSQSACGLKTTGGFEAAGVYLQKIGVPRMVAGGAVAVLSRWWLILLYAGLSLWVRRSKDDMGWIIAWVIFSGCVFMFVVKIRFPWYLIWAWMPSLVCWKKVYVYLSAICFVLGVWMTMLYTIPVK